MAREELAIFPLTTVVLFPCVQTPLHIFEQRYRQMTAEALAGDRQIGMVVIPEAHAHTTAGDPPVHPIGCAGEIGQAQKLPDGRYNFVLQGTWRFRILSEPAAPAERLYRTAIAERLDDPFPENAREPAAALRRRIVEQVSTLVQRSDPRRARQVSPEIFAGVDDPVFVNSMCQALAFPPQEKLALLEAPSVLSRFELLEGLLSFRVARDGLHTRTGSSSVH